MQPIVFRYWAGWGQHITSDKETLAWPVSSQWMGKATLLHQFVASKQPRIPNATHQPRSWSPCFDSDGNACLTSLDCLLVGFCYTALVQSEHWIGWLRFRV